MEGYKELIDIWIAETEEAKFWAQVLTELNNQELKFVLLSLRGKKTFAIIQNFPLQALNQLINSLKRNFHLLAIHTIRFVKNLFQ